MIILFCCFIIVMNANLTPEQVKLLQQLQKQKIQHRESQKKYRESKSNYKDIQKTYNETRNVG